MLCILSHRTDLSSTTHIQEEPFAHEFLNHNGLNELMDVIFKSTGNTLAVR